MYVAQAGLQLTPDPPAIPSQVPRLQAHTTSPADLGVLFVCWFVWSFFFLRISEAVWTGLKTGQPAFMLCVDGQARAKSGESKATLPAPVALPHVGDADAAVDREGCGQVLVELAEPWPIDLVH